MPAMIQDYEHVCEHCGHRERGQYWISRTTDAAADPDAPATGHGQRTTDNGRTP